MKKGTVGLWVGGDWRYEVVVEDDVVHGKGSAWVCLGIGST